MNTTYALSVALPYANGNLHIGHIYEAVIADIKSRLYTHQNFKHIFVCGADSHGSATTLYCQKNNLDVATHLSTQHTRNQAVYNAFDISFEYSKTNTPLHHFVVNECVELIHENENLLGKVFDTKNVLGWFDETSEQFLPDRYIKGTCPHCKTLNQVEICDHCQAKIENKDLINPQSSISDKPVILKSNKHLVLKTSGFYEFLIDNQDKIPSSIRDFVLNNRNDNEYIDISREKPYYGIEINKDYLDVKEQCFYVWFDAPIGYITFAYEQSLLTNPREKSRQDFRDFIKNLKFEHFIGKDIIYFHTFLWFNLLKFINAGRLNIEKINVHGWITQNQKKQSKRDGAQLDPEISKRDVREYRLFFFANYNGTQDDVEISADLVQDEYESLIVNKFGNFYSRSVKIIDKNKAHTLRAGQIPDELIHLIQASNYKAAYKRIHQEITELNSQFSESQPWKTANDEATQIQLINSIQKWIDLFKVLCLVIPEFSEHEEKILRLEPFYLDKRR